MSKNIVLTGFMGTGKSVVGTELSNRLGFAFVDTDEKIVQSENMPVSDIFKGFGEAYFRELEAAVIKKISTECNSTVISTGGGAVLNSENLELLRQNGIIFNLSADVDTIVLRIGGKSGRPLADGKSREDIENRLNSRKAAYENCDYQVSVDNKTVKQVADEILRIYEEENA